MPSTAVDPRDRAFEGLYRRYARDVYRFVLAIVRNPTEAEDVTQTAFLNAYKAFKRGEEPERPRSWLFAIAHNAIRSRARFRLRRPREVPFDETALDLPVAAEEREAVAEVLEALGELPVNQREALAMRELEGRSYPEIAETLGVSVPAVESLIFRARRTLRKQRTSLRGLTVVQLPRSLRTLWQTQPDAVSAGLAAKAAVVVAAASVVAGGVLGSGTAGASQHASAVGRHEPSRPHLLVAHPQPSRAAAVLQRTAAPTRQATVTARKPRRSAAPPAAHALPALPAAAAPTLTTSTASGAPAVPAPDPGTAAAVPAKTVPQAAATVVAAAATVTRPVSVPPPPAVTAPALPPVPQPPPLPSPPQVPGVPQVPPVNGIK